MGSTSRRGGFAGEGVGSSGGRASSGRKGTGEKGMWASSRPGWSRANPQNRFVVPSVDVKMRW